MNKVVKIRGSTPSSSKTTRLSRPIDQHHTSKLSYSRKVEMDHLISSRSKRRVQSINKGTIWETYQHLLQEKCAREIDKADCKQKSEQRAEENRVEKGKSNSALVQRKEMTLAMSAKAKDVK